MIIKQFILAALSSICFGIFFNSPKSSLKEAAFTGGLSWSVAYITNEYTHNIILASFIGCVLVGTLSEVFATHKKKPATIYLIASIIPFVPGAGTYYALRFFLDKDYMLAFEKGVETIGIAMAISFGLIFASFFSAPIRRMRIGFKKRL